METLGKEIVQFIQWLGLLLSVFFTGWGFFSMLREGRLPQGRRDMGRPFRLLTGGVLAGGLFTAALIMSNSLTGEGIQKDPDFGETPFGVEPP